MHPKQLNFKAISQFYSKGFTLIETVIGIVVLAISFSVLVTLIYPMTEQSADQLHQIKAAELGQSLLNEIQNKAFDENSDKTGGLVRCGEAAPAPACTTVMGADGSETRATYDDVDDYNEINHGNAIQNSLNDNSLNSSYLGYSVDVTVCNDGDYNGQCDGTTNIAKLITVTVSTPTGFDIVFSTYRANF